MVITPNRGTEETPTLLHDNVTLFKCNICHKSFKRSTNLYAHKISHSTEKNSNCPICGKSFKSLMSSKICISRYKMEGKSFQCSFSGYNSTLKTPIDVKYNMRKSNIKESEICYM